MEDAGNDRHGEELVAIFREFSSKGAEEFRQRQAKPAGVEVKSVEEQQTMLDETYELAGVAPAPDKGEEQPKPKPAPVVTFSGVERDSEGFVTGPFCGEPDCPVQLVDERDFPGRSKARKWYCPVHRSEHPQDMQDWTSPYAIDPNSGAIIDVEAQRVEAQRQLERERSLKARRQAEEAEAKVTGEALAAAEKARREADKRMWDLTFRPAP